MTLLAIDLQYIAILSMTAAFLWLQTLTTTNSKPSSYPVVRQCHQITPNNIMDSSSPHQSISQLPTGGFIDEVCPIFFLHQHLTAKLKALKYKTSFELRGAVLVNCSLL